MHYRLKEARQFHDGERKKLEKRLSKAEKERDRLKGEHAEQIKELREQHEREKAELESRLESAKQQAKEERQNRHNEVQMEKDRHSRELEEAVSSIKNKCAPMLEIFSHRVSIHSPLLLQVFEQHARGP